LEGFRGCVEVGTIDKKGDALARVKMHIVLSVSAETLSPKRRLDRSSIPTRAQVAQTPCPATAIKHSVFCPIRENYTSSSPDANDNSLSAIETYVQSREHIV
jgi:hypothetical protein